MRLLYTTQMTRRIPDQEIEDGKDLFRAMLWMKRLKATPGRLAIIEILNKEKEPLSVDELKKKLSGRDLIIDLNSVTVYRALDVLVKVGLVNKTNAGKAHATYEMAFGKPHHHHITCTSCGDMEDVHGCDSKDLNISARAHLKKFKSVQSHSLEFFGLCRKCEEK